MSVRNTNLDSQSVSSRRGRAGGANSPGDERNGLGVGKDGIYKIEESCCMCELNGDKTAVNQTLILSASLEVS